MATTSYPNLKLKGNLWTDLCAVNAGMANNLCTIQNVGGDDFTRNPRLRIYFGGVSAPPTYADGIIIDSMGAIECNTDHIWVCGDTSIAMMKNA